VNIIQKSSPNKMSRNGWKPDIIVCHITEGSYAGAVSWLCNTASKASAHFVVSKNGEVTQLVPLNMAAWANGTSTDASSSVYYGKAKSSIVRSRKTNANYYTVSIEHEGVYSQTHGALTDKQLSATIELIKYIRSEVKRIYGIDIPIDRQHIIGHYEIAPVTKPHCPGEKFPFNEIIQALTEKQKETEVIDMDTIVTYYGDADAFAAIVVAQKLKAPLMKKADYEASGLKAKKVVQIGGGAGDRFDTFKKAAEML
jgi:N-acetyl-anhydromuramyl-L-alanine amidase AmpD